jgi:thiol-disulfide isomerase/thioredoxin
MTDRNGDRLTPRLTLFGLAAIAAVAVLGAIAFAFSGNGGAPHAAVGGEAVEILRGAHTVHHSRAPLPTADTPRGDGRATLVWFSATWCTTCRSMAPFAAETAAGFADRLHFVEKSIDHDRESAARYGVRGTPTFVVIDARGEELGRFLAQRDAAAFTAAIETALPGG